MTDADDTPLAMTADRKRAILTQRDREILLGEAEYENKQQVRDARYRIRQRIIAALLDIQLLAYQYPLSEHAAIIERLYEDDYQPEREGTIYDYTMDLFDFGVDMAAAGVEYEHVDANFGKPVEDLEDYLERILRQSIKATHDKHYPEDEVVTVGVDITIDREAFDEDNMIRQLIYGETTRQTFISYLQHGDVEKLREKMRQADEEIVYRSTEGEEIRLPPDHPWIAPIQSI